MNKAPSWGRLNNKRRACAPFSKSMNVNRPGSLLAYGNGRSYGDTCHNDQGTLITSQDMASIISFDQETGILVAEPGVLLGDILNHLRDTSWFLPVVPGTKFITLGGAIANDIHGKNHEKMGTFGCHVRSFDLWRSDQSVVTCSARKNQKLFAATIGGMGLTGVILRAEIQLMKVASHFVRETKRPFESLDEYFDYESSFSSGGEYSVAWVDSLARGKSMGRGIMMRADHCCHNAPLEYGKPKMSIPLTPPVPLVSGLPLRIFNSVYFYGNKSSSYWEPTDPNGFFFPLDTIAGWNRLYGLRGLFQHQCVIPLDASRETIAKLLAASHEAGQGSFLTVLKRFGEIDSPGLMSFPQPGYTLTLDFANKGFSTRILLDRLDAITLDAGGRTNPYKDGRMSAETFQRGFPDWKDLEAARDPAMQSDFWRRVSATSDQDRIAVKAPSIETPVNQAAKGEVHIHAVNKERDKRPAQTAVLGRK